MSTRSAENKNSIFLVIIFIILAATAIIMIFALQTDEIKNMLQNDELVKLLLF